MLVLKIAGEQYVPLRAIPFITGGFLSAQRVISMLLDPVGNSEDTGRIVLAYRLDEHNRLLQLLPASLERHLGSAPLKASNTSFDAAAIENLKRLPPAVHVRRDELYEFFVRDLAHAQAYSDHPALRFGGPFQWDEHPMLDDELRSVVFEGIATDVTRTPTREEAPPDIAELRRTVEAIVGSFAEQGCELSLSPLDITKTQMEDIVKKQNPQLAAAMGDKAIRRALLFIGVKGRPGVKTNESPAMRIAREILNDK